MLSYKPIKDINQLYRASLTHSIAVATPERELNEGRAVLQIVEKLPMDLKERWLTINYEVTGSGSAISLEDVVRLVETEAEKRAESIFAPFSTRVVRPTL